MNGAHALLATLSKNGVDTCFANPGTSEMHFVAGLDDARDMRAILCLFEGVATGAADGYGRVRGTPAATLLHLGPGLANGWANLHNARRAHTPLVNIVGDHATYHSQFDAPLQSDILSVASALEGWQRRTTRPDNVARDTADAIAAALAPPGSVATLVLPADASWGEIESPPDEWPEATRSTTSEPDEAAVRHAVDALRTRKCALFLGGASLASSQLSLAHRVAHATRSRLICETFPSILDRGAGVPGPERLIYLSEFAISQLRDVEVLILIGAHEPVGFFAYPDVSSRLVAEGCEVIALAPPGVDTAMALATLVQELKVPPAPQTFGEAPAAPSGALSTASFAAAIGATMPEDLIVADESNTGGVHLFAATQSSPPHRWMTLTGGSIGFGLPVALGAAVGSGQRVLALEADGSMMYTPQALWTMAREQLDVTVVALSNRSYAILNLERQRVGAVSEGATSQRMLDLDDPALNLCDVATGLGVPSQRVTTADELVRALETSYATPGPRFIEAMLPKGLS
ncbi:MAG: acetolactate synthase large subunit [Acidobacteria bacterium]|nr:acetolactate synthase large subunit [Acidobacteriota bacterium]